MKTPAVLKHQQFGDSGSDEIEPRGSKRQCLNERKDEEENGLNNKEGNDLDDKERKGLNKDEGEIEGGRYIPPPFVPLSFLPQKVFTCPSDLGKGIRSLKHIICIPKIFYSRSDKFALEFAGRGDSKTQKKIYTSRLREGLESHLASTASTTSDTTNNYCLIRKCLEYHPLSNHRQDLGTHLAPTSGKVLDLT